MLKCVSQLKIAKNSLKLPILAGQGRSRSSMLVPPGSSSAVLVMTCSKSVSICNRSHARRVNKGKIAVPLFEPLVRGESPHPAAPNLLTRNWKLYAIIRWKPGVSISPGLESVPGRDGQTNGQTNLRRLVRA